MQTTANLVFHGRQTNPKIRPMLSTSEITHKPRILVVDDEYKIVFTLKNIFEKEGYEVTVSLSGQEAISVVVAQRGRFDLVLLDYLMPAMRGDEVAARLKALYPALTIAYVSAFEIPEPGKSFADAYFVKPESPAVIVRLVRDLISQKRAASAGF